MKTLLVLILVIAAFAGGIWYANEYHFALPVLNDEVATTTDDTPAVINPNPTPTPQATYQNADGNMIVVSTPKPGATVPNSFSLTGQARGGWYFEASFPFEVRSATGTLLVQAPVQADGEWMTTEFVPFSETVTVPSYYKGAATLILHKDNPSGLPENAASISIPIVIQ